MCEHCITVTDGVCYSTVAAGGLFVILSETRQWFCSGLSRKRRLQGVSPEKKLKYDRNEMKCNEAGKPTPEIRATLTLESYHSSVLFDQTTKAGQFTAALFIRWQMNRLSWLFSSAPALVLPSCIFRCAWMVCTAQAIRREHGVTGHFVPLSQPLSNVTKRCILSTDPYDNTGCAASE